MACSRMQISAIIIIIIDSLHAKRKHGRSILSLTAWMMCPPQVQNIDIRWLAGTLETETNSKVNISIDIDACFQKFVKWGHNTDFPQHPWETNFILTNFG